MYPDQSQCLVQLVKYQQNDLKPCYTVYKTIRLDGGVDLIFSKLNSSANICGLPSRVKCTQISVFSATILSSNSMCLAYMIAII